MLQRGNDLLFGDDGDGATTAAVETTAVSTVKLVVPEGFALRDITARAARVGIPAAQLQAAAKAAKPPEGFLTGKEKAASIEGFLFPATYDLVEPPQARALVAQQLEAFEENWSQVNMKFARSKGLTQYDVLKIASLIEREAADQQDRAKIAAVIYNRLKARMPLGIDATTQYEIGEWRVPTAAELRRNTPYNTRIRRGLPPTPIANPGLASMKAAANPAKGPWLYYVAIPGDEKRRHFFTASFEEFLQFQRDNPPQNG